MPLRSRPLFLVPSLMRQLPDTGAVMVDLGQLDAADVTATPHCDAADALLDQLEPLIVEANLAGWEITTIAAGTAAAAPCVLISVETFLVDAVTSTWEEVVTGVTVSWSSVEAALALQFVPRLAMREAIDGGSVLPSHYAIEFQRPSSWLGAVDPGNGGWLVAAVSSIVELPEGLTTIAGSPGPPGTLATDLTLAIRAAASAAWEAHGRSPGQLANCALGALFDTRPDAGERRATWRLPAGDVGVAEVAAVIESGVWGGTSGVTPSYADLSGLTLRELLVRSRGQAGADRALEEIRAALRRELIRRHLVDPATIEGSSLREGELGPRFDELYATIEGFGSGLFGRELFRMLELGLMSLDRRDAAEEMLPALVEREWTEPILTGFYDSIGSPPEISIDDLADEESAHERFVSVAATGAVISVNQAGDHIAGYWFERRFDPSPGGGPTTIIEWVFGGDRDGTASGLVFDVIWVSGEETVRGTYSFSEVTGNLEAVAAWDETSSFEAGTMTCRRRSSSRSVVFPGEESAEDPRTDFVRPFWSDAEIDTLPTAVPSTQGEPPRGLRERVREAERYSLHPYEFVLLHAIVGRVAADLEAITNPSGLSTDEREALCDHLTTAFAYFHRDGRPSKHVAAARAYVRAELLATEGNNSSLDVLLDEPAPLTYLHALAKRHSEFRCVPDPVEECLGMQPNELAWFAENHIYESRFAISLTPEKFTKDQVAGKLTDALIKKLLPKASFVMRWLVKLKKVAGVGPTPQFDVIRAEFRKVGPYPDPDWPGPGQSVFFDGYLVGGGLAVTIGMSMSSLSEWSTIDAMGDPWSPTDFAGPLMSGAVYSGGSTFGLEVIPEEAMNWLRKQLGFGPIRSSIDLTYVQFITDDKTDVWSFSRGYTNSFGLHAELGAGVTLGYLWLEGDEPDPSVLLPGESSGGPIRREQVSFEIGRSELTPDGHALLRDVAATRLHELASPSTEIEVFGHASFGDASLLYNLTLSQRRAANVVRALRAYLGPLYAVPPERTWVFGLGDQQAEEDGGPDELWRRVDVYINGDHAVQFTAASP